MHKRDGRCQLPGGPITRRFRLCQFEKFVCRRSFQGAFGGLPGRGATRRPVGARSALAGMAHLPQTQLTADLVRDRCSAESSGKPTYWGVGRPRRGHSLQLLIMHGTGQHR